MRTDRPTLQEDGDGVVHGLDGVGEPFGWQVVAAGHLGDFAVGGDEASGRRAVPHEGVGDVADGDVVRAPLLDVRVVGDGRGARDEVRAVEWHVPAHLASGLWRALPRDDAFVDDGVVDLLAVVVVFGDERAGVFVNVFGAAVGASASAGVSVFGVKDACTVLELLVGPVGAAVVFGMAIAGPWLHHVGAPVRVVEWVLVGLFLREPAVLTQGEAVAVFDGPVVVWGSHVRGLRHGLVPVRVKSNDCVCGVWRFDRLVEHAILVEGCFGLEYAPLAKDPLFRFALGDGSSRPYQECPTFWFGQGGEFSVFGHLIAVSDNDVAWDVVRCVSHLCRGDCERKRDFCAVVLVVKVPPFSSFCVGGLEGAEFAVVEGCGAAGLVVLLPVIPCALGERAGLWRAGEEAPGAPELAVGVSSEVGVHDLAHGLLAGLAVLHVVDDDAVAEVALVGELWDGVGVEVGEGGLFLLGLGAGVGLVDEGGGGVEGLEVEVVLAAHGDGHVELLAVLGEDESALDEPVECGLLGLGVIQGVELAHEGVHVLLREVGARLGDEGAVLLFALGADGEAGVGDFLAEVWVGAVRVLLARRRGLRERVVGRQWHAPRCATADGEACGGLVGGAEVVLRGVDEACAEVGASLSVCPRGSRGGGVGDLAAALAPRPREGGAVEVMRELGERAGGVGLCDPLEGGAWGLGRRGGLAPVASPLRVGGRRLDGGGRCPADGYGGVAEGELAVEGAGEEAAGEGRKVLFEGEGGEASRDAERASEGLAVLGGGGAFVVACEAFEGVCDGREVRGGALVILPGGAAEGEVLRVEAREAEAPVAFRGVQDLSGVRGECAERAARVEAEDGCACGEVEGRRVGHEAEEGVLVAAVVGVERGDEGLPVGEDEVPVGEVVEVHRLGHRLAGEDILLPAPGGVGDEVVPETVAGVGGEGFGELALAGLCLGAVADDGAPRGGREEGGVEDEVLCLRVPHPAADDAQVLVGERDVGVPVLHAVDIEAGEECGGELFWVGVFDNVSSDRLDKVIGLPSGHFVCSPILPVGEVCEFAWVEAEGVDGREPAFSVFLRYGLIPNEQVGFVPFWTVDPPDLFMEGILCVGHRGIFVSGCIEPPAIGERAGIGPDGLEAWSVVGDGRAGVQPADGAAGVDIHAGICDSVSGFAGVAVLVAGQSANGKTRIFQLQHFERVDTVSVLLALLYGDVGRCLLFSECNRRDISADGDDVGVVILVRAFLDECGAFVQFADTCDRLVVLRHGEAIG